MLGGLESRSRVLVSGVAVLVLVVPLVALLRDLLGWWLALAVIMASWAGFYVLLGRLVAAALAGLTGAAAAVAWAGAFITEQRRVPAREDVDDFIDFDDIYIDDPEGELLVWGLAESLYKLMGGKEGVVVVVVEDGVTMTSYPPERYVYIDTEELEAAEPPKAQRDQEAGIVAVTLDTGSFRLLSSAAKRGQGESVIVDSVDALRALYGLARALAQVVAGEGPLASYVAYKALLKAYSTGLLKLKTPSLLDELPFEDASTRRMVREQVAEELGLRGGRRE